MTFAYRLVTSAIKGLARMLCRFDDSQLARVPDRGPLIIVANHVNFLEVPVIYTHLQPRPVTGFAKAENWANPLMRPLANLWRAIPLRRGEADVSAIRAGLAVLAAGDILAVAPEGTRSGHGRLQRGRPGVALLAIRSNSPLLPMACYGHETVWQNLQRLRRTDFNLVVGQPFRLSAAGYRPSRGERQRMVDEVMYQVAALLPSQYRGVYADLSAATEDHLCFGPGAVSSLSLARA
jgi:1-acyl-sn-glycerol-3-phosphate acyltransferase